MAEALLFMTIQTFLHVRVKLEIWARGDIGYQTQIFENRMNGLDM